MPLSEPVQREEIHCRRLEIRAYRRADGLYDIEGRLTDTKPFAYPMLEKTLAPGEPVHDMRLRLTVDRALVVQRAEAQTAAGPYGACGETNAGFAVLAGLQIGAGWNRRTRELLGGKRSCTHLVEMLAQMATASMQAVWSDHTGDGLPDPNQIDQCHAYRADGALVRTFWPHLATGAAAPVDGED